MSVASVERSLAIDAAMKACEHFAGEITSGIPLLPSSSTACEELKMAAEALIACLPMVEITKKNSKFVEGVVCQIIEPDLQQTASYFRRMREKGPERVESSLRRHQDGLEKRAERMWNCINALSSAADGSDGLPAKKTQESSSPKAVPEHHTAGVDSCPLPPLSSLSSVQSSVRHVARSKSQNDAGHHAAPPRPGSVPLGTPSHLTAAHFPPKAPASFRPPRSLRPLHTPHAYANHLHPFNPSSPMAFSHSSGTPAAMSGHLPFSPSPHVSSGFAPPQSPAFCSAPLPGTAVAEPPMAAFLQSAADAARRFRKSNSLTPRHSTLRPRSTSPTKPPLSTAPTAYPEIFSPRSSRSNSAKLPVSEAAQGPLPDLDHTIRAALSAQEELSAELDRADAMAVASAAERRGAPFGVDGELAAHLRASATAIEAVSRELGGGGGDDEDDTAFGRTLQQAASAQDEMSRELDLKEANRAWAATVAAAASAQDELSHELELRSSTAAPGGTSGSIGDAFGELERQVEEVSREMQSMPGVARSSSGKPPRSGSLRREPEWDRNATLGIEEVDDFADEAADVLAEGGL